LLLRVPEIVALSVFKKVRVTGSIGMQATLIRKFLSSLKRIHPSLEYDPNVPMFQIPLCLCPFQGL